jgi:integrase
MQMQKKLNWTEPKLVPKKPTDTSKDWRVRFSFYHNGKWQTVSVKNGNNYYKDLKERLEKFNGLIKTLTIQLQSGWNPITGNIPIKTSAEDEIDQLKELNFADALDFAYRKKLKEWSKKTAQDYSSKIKYLKIAAQKLDLHEKQISDFKKPHFKLILDEVTELRKLEEIGYNNYRTFLSALIGEIVEWEVLEYNPIEKIKVRPTKKTFAHKPPTPEQREIIIDHIKKANPNYYRFISVLYACTIREKEILGLRISDLNKVQQTFTIRKEISKTRVQREAVIPNSLMRLLSQLNLHAYPPEYFIFSKDFSPGEIMMHSNSARNPWKRIVKDGLGFDVDLYGLKKLGGNDLVDLGIDHTGSNLLQIARLQMGHASDKMSEVYVTKHKEITMNLIKERMGNL